MAVLVCDAIPGKGKTSACINMMNRDLDSRFIFVTQYLTEVDRIKQGCAGREFLSPERKYENGFRKLSDIEDLLRKGKNIATTHALFTSYTEDTKQYIRDGRYTLVLDEVVDVMGITKLAKCDIEVLFKGGVLKEDEGGVCEWDFEEYGDDKDGLFYDEMLKARSKNFLHFMDRYFCWTIPPDLFTCFRNVYVLTYLFYGQPLRCFFDVHGIGYSYIDVREGADGYEFCGTGESSRSVELRDKIHVLAHDGANSIGEGRTSLSFNWYRKESMKDGQPGLVKLKRSLQNVFRNVYHCSANENLWTTYKAFAGSVKGKGYWTSFISYNKRASNEYADRRYLAYLVNNFPRPWEAEYYRARDSDMSSGTYALSILIQWVFRSAIRNGQEVWLYLPSARMRGLLAGWLEALAKGEDLQYIRDLAVEEREIRNKKQSIKQSAILQKTEYLRGFKGRGS